jgi:serine/threonine-protein kinase GIN4/serine/threonine-protein kinase KCC4
MELIQNQKIQILQKLGEGFSSNVYICKFQNKEYAIKILKDNPTSKNYFEKEISILKKINNNYITNLITYGNSKFEFDKNTISNNYYIILDLGKKGELFNYILYPKKGFSESQTRYIFKQILKGVKSIHDNGIIHLDLKIENIMIDEFYNVKISDFGFSIDNTNKELINIFQGSEKYKAPEIILKKPFIGFYADVFSLGVILFLILTGNYPFKSARKYDICYSNIIKGKIDNYWFLLKKKIFGDNDNNLPSEEFRDLFIKMIQFEPNDRISINEILNHPWMNKDLSTKDDIVNEFKNREHCFNNNIVNCNCSLVLEKKSKE